MTFLRIVISLYPFVWSMIFFRKPVSTFRDHALFLQAHRLLCRDVGGQLLVAGSVAVLAQEECGQIEIGLVAELPGAVGRHGRLGLADQRRQAAVAKAPTEIRALERRTAELAVVEGAAVAILAIALIRDLAALRLLGGDAQRRRRGRWCGPGNAARRRGNDLLSQRQHFGGGHALRARRRDVRRQDRRKIARQELVVSPGG